MIYVKLKEFRAKHGKMKQSDLAKLFGIGQTDVSRMEQNYKLLTDEQYQILVDNYGKEDIERFVLPAPKGKPTLRLRYVCFADYKESILSSVRALEKYTGQTISEINIKKVLNEAGEETFKMNITVE